MSFGDFLKPAQPGTEFHGYSHAAYVFRADAFRLHPKYQFLFWVRIKLNENITGDESLREDSKILGALAKSVSLPKFSVETKTLNAYNRVNIVQTKLKYDPVTIKFHDDGADVIRKFWYDYYSFYYRDSDYLDSVYQTPHKYTIRPTDSWGYSLRGESPDVDISTQPEDQFIQSIEIFSFHQKKFNQITLQNPKITAFRHGEHDMAQGTGLLEHEMTLAYETVTYASGYLNPTNFGDDMLLLYDQTPSPLSSDGVYSSVNPDGTVVQSQQPAVDTVVTDGIPRPVTSRVTPFSYGDTSGGSLSTATMSQAMSGGFNPGTLLSGAGIGGASGANQNVFAKVGVGLATGMISNLMRGRKPNTKLNAPTISNLLYQAGDIAGGQIGAQLKAAGGLTRAGAAIARGGIGPGNMGTAVVAINAAAALFGKKPQDFLPGGRNGSVTTNGQKVGNPLYSSFGTAMPSFPKIGASSPNYGSGGVQTIPTPNVIKAYSGNYNYSDSRPTMNDAADLAGGGDQGSFTI